MQDADGHIERLDEQAPPQVTQAFAEGFAHGLARAALVARLREQRMRNPRSVHNARRRANLPLTQRELEVLRLIGSGATNKKIAGALAISEQTVKSHVKSILRKLGAANRTEAASRLGPTRLNASPPPAPRIGPWPNRG